MSLWARAAAWIRRKLYRLNPGELDALIEDMMAYAGAYEIELDNETWRCIRISQQHRHELEVE